MLKWFVCTRELITAAILTMFAFAFQTGSMKHTHTQKQTHYLCGQCKQFSYEKETDYSVCCQNRKDPASVLDLKQKQKLS